jgi:hypothetical protein
VAITLTGPDGRIGKPYLLDFQEPEVTTLLFPDAYKDKPGVAKAHVEGNQVRASKVGKYAVEVLVVDDPTASTKADEYTPVKPRLEEGRPFVDVKRGQAYAVRLTNDSDHDAAVVLSIDGLHIHHFVKDDKGKPVAVTPHLWVRKKSSVLVVGWRTSPGQLSRFVVTDRDLGAWKSANASADSVGRIVAQFHACWDKPENKPKDEPKLKRDSKSGEESNSRGLSTGMGDKINSPLKIVPMIVGHLRESVPVLYSRPKK